MFHEPPYRILVLMSDTGGGHRAAASAIENAVQARYPKRFHFSIVDVFRDYTPPPFRYAPELYPLCVNHAEWLWHLSYRLTDTRKDSARASQFCYWAWRPSLERLLADHPADLILNVHPIILRPVLHVLQGQTAPPTVMTVVTDLVTTHAFWYDPRVDRCLVPTPAARDRALALGLRPEQVAVTGLPIHPDFTRRLQGKHAARKTLGLRQDLLTVLVVAGGEGMGQLGRIAESLNAARLPIQLLIVAGRNQRLEAHLRGLRWNQPTLVYGFVEFMPLLMAAADMLVTKAGPATLMEACAAGLPMVISGAIAGQEEGNVAHIVDNGAGVFAPGVEAVTATVRAWVRADPRLLRQKSRAARALATPHAAQRVAEEMAALLGLRDSAPTYLDAQRV